MNIFNKSNISSVKKTSFFRGVRQFWPFLRPYWFLGVLGTLLTIPVGAFDAAVASFLKPFIDNVMIAQQASYAKFIPLIIIVFTLFQGFFVYFSSLVNTVVGARVCQLMKIRLYSKLLCLDCNYFDLNSTGNILFRFNTDPELASNALIANIKLFLTRCFSSLSLIGVLLYNSWQLSFLALSVLLLCVFPIYLSKKIINTIVDKSVKSSMDILTVYNETFNGIRLIKSFSLKNVFLKSFLEKANNLFNLSLKLVCATGWLSPILHLIGAVGVSAVLYYGLILILDNVITSGAFVSFIAALLMLYSPLKSIGNNYVQLQNSLLALDRIYDILNISSFEDSVSAGQINLTSIQSEIIFKNVHFSYDGSREILKGISLTIPVGKKIALVGNSGGGKTTVCSLIPRLYNVTKGSILIDGKNIKDYSLSSLRSQIAVVFQDNFLFEGTIRENIVCARENATEEEIQTAVKSACLDEFLKTLPQGIDTKIGERGVTLSGGQKQRVAIARAIIKNASLVILDEATSALDNKSEKIVQQALDNLMKGKTTIVIAHRLSTIRDADQIVVLNDGQIAEQGTHEELLEKKGVYANLYLSQFK